MEICICQRDADIAFLITKVKDHDKDLNGNGKQGVKIEVATLKFEHEHNMKDIAKMAEAYETLAKKQSNREAILNFLGKAILQSSIVLGAAGVVISIIFAFSDKAL